MFNGEEQIARGLGNSIYSLTKRNEDYGVGFNLILNKDYSVTLELMDDCSKFGKVINRIKSNQPKSQRVDGFIAEMVNFLEVAVFNIN